MGQVAHHPLVPQGQLQVQLSSDTHVNKPIKKRKKTETKKLFKLKGTLLSVRFTWSNQKGKYQYQPRKITRKKEKSRISGRKRERGKRKKRKGREEKEIKTVMWALNKLLRIHNYSTFPIIPTGFEFDRKTRPVKKDLVRLQEGFLTHHIENQRKIYHYKVLIKTT